MPDTFLSVSKATDDAREMGLNHTLLTVLASVLPGCMQHGRQAGRQAAPVYFADRGEHGALPCTPLHGGFLPQ